MSQDSDLQGLKVMVIDDSKTIRRTAESLLKKAGCEVMTAVDGFEALAKIVDDEPDIRSFVVAALNAQGYRVLEAASIKEATRLLEEETGNIDLLLSDVVLPGSISGPEFAAKAKELHPNLRLVFMSGYTADLYTHGKVPGYEETLLTKPFRRAELTQAIEDALGV